MSLSLREGLSDEEQALRVDGEQVAVNYMNEWSAQRPGRLFGSLTRKLRGAYWPAGVRSKRARNLSMAATASDCW